MFELIDTHAHLDEIEDLEPTLTRAREAGVAAIVAMGTNHQTNQKVMELSQQHSGLVYPALGLHPWDIGNLDTTQTDHAINFIETNIRDIVAIGEIGLDYNKRVLNIASKERQKEVLKCLLALAERHKKLVSLHSRYAWKGCFDLVKGAGIEQAIFHWFTGFSSVLREILDAGYYISATPAAEYHEEHRRAIKEAPLGKLLLETDCPVSYGRENRYLSQPSDVVRSLKAVVAIKGIDESAIAYQTTANAARLFSLHQITNGGH
jgi:TatD DNase family protein